MTISTAFRVRALPATTLDTVRRTGRDSAGRPVEALPAGGGEPLRCCLRDAEAGESLLLFGYAAAGRRRPVPGGRPGLRARRRLPRPDVGNVRRRAGRPARWATVERSHSVHRVCAGSCRPSRRPCCSWRERRYQLSMS
ncbi:DUF1203 domain-containing protein [Micromonospora sp. CA-259024]|uniref:DUF1203 domain-containing protein n=1 Tax=Micromonospora sp. CA-259024 TaxID=3239965 RepID=UPI003D925DDC